MVWWTDLGAALELPLPSARGERRVLGYFFFFFFFSAAIFCWHGVHLWWLDLLGQKDVPHSEHEVGGRVAAVLVACSRTSSNPGTLPLTRVMGPDELMSRARALSLIT